MLQGKFNGVFFLRLIFEDINSLFVRCRKAIVHIFLLEDELNILGIYSLSKPAEKHGIKSKLNEFGFLTH